MIRYFITVALLLCTTSGFAIRQIFPVKWGQQEEILINGKSILTSKKQYAVTLFPTFGHIRGGRGFLTFAIHNPTSTPFNLYFQNVHITDQFGRAVYVVPKQVLMGEEQCRTNWVRFASFLFTACDAICAQGAGTVHYHEMSTTRGHHNAAAFSPWGGFHAHEDFSSTTITHGTAYSPALQLMAYDRVAAHAIAREGLIAAHLNDTAFWLANSYFDSNTIFPHTVYETGFYFEMPTWVERGINTLYIHFDLNGERHTFCYSCW